MGRPPSFTKEAILGEAKRLVTEGGVEALRMSSIAKALDAPSGSIYHRFPSRDHLAAELWLSTVERFQARFAARLSREGPPIEVAVDAAQSVIDWAGQHPSEAVILTWFKRDQLVSGAVAELADRARLLERQMHDALNRLAVRLERPTSLTQFAVVGIPYALVRPYVGGELPDWARAKVAAAVIALLT